MKKKVLVILSVILFLLVVSLGAGIYYASTKITPEEVHKQALMQLGKTFPKARIDLGKLDLSFGFSTSLKVNKLHIHIPKGYRKAELFSVKNMTVKIPLWAIIFGSGKIEVEIEKPNVYYKEYASGNNWKYAMGDKKKTTKVVSKTVAKPSKSTVATKSKDSAVVIPGFLSGIKFNFKLVDMQFGYRLKKDRNDSVINVSMFKIKDLNFKKTTAVEIDSRMNFDKQASFDLRIISELDLSKLIEKQNLPVNMQIRINELKLAQLPNELPEIVTDIKFELKTNDNSLLGVVKTEIGGTSNSIAARYSVDARQNVKVDKINIHLAIQELMEMIGFEEKILDAKRSVFTMNGGVAIISNKIVPGIKFKLDPGITFNHHGVSGTTGLQGEYIDKALNVTSVSKLLEGSINVVFKTIFDLNKKKIDIAKLDPFKLDINLNNIKLTRPIIQKILYSGSSKGKKDSKDSGAKSAKQSKTSTGISKKPAPIVLPPGKINLELKELFIGKERFSGDGRIGVRPDRVVTSKLGFKLGDGTINVRKHSTVFSKNGDIKNLFGIKLANINFESFSVFLPPDIEELKGNISADAGGKAVIGNDGKLTHDIKVTMTAKGGEIKGLNLKKYVETYTSKVSFLKKMSKKKHDIPEGFEKFYMKGRFTEKAYTLSKIDFVSKDKWLGIKEIKAGIIYPVVGGRDSVLELNAIDLTGKLGLKQKTKMDKIPVRFKGQGFALKPDIGYTVAKGASAYMKTQGKKKIQDAVKKIFKGKKGKSPLDKMLKGKKNPFGKLFGN
ncbi:MAG: hypothetical protein KAQ98_00320 [Bacteriovoracaceae bacterium]|nr:hypothetical protein [Bacteriovoracaceae bacterium]